MAAINIRVLAMYNASTRPLDAWDEANMMALQVAFYNKPREDKHGKTMGSVNAETEQVQMGQAGVGQVDRVEQNQGPGK